MNNSRAKLKKIAQQNLVSLKKKLTSELAVSINELREDVEPWIEIIDGKEDIFKRIENIKSFGTLTFVFAEKLEFGEGAEILLPFTLRH